MLSEHDGAIGIVTRMGRVDDAIEHEQQAAA